MVLYVEDLRCVKSSYEQCPVRTTQTDSRLLDARGLGEGARAPTDKWILGSLGIDGNVLKSDTWW